MPAKNDLMTWIVQHSGELISKYQVNRNGNTAYEKAWGQPCKDDIVEFLRRSFLSRKMVPSPKDTSEPRVLPPLPADQQLRDPPKPKEAEVRAPLWPRIGESDLTRW